jgi:hypothetical protein
LKGSKLLDLLFQEEVINDREKQRIVTKQVPFEKTEELLCVIPRKGINELRKFYLTLGQTHFDLYAHLRQQILNIYPSAINDLPESKQLGQYIALILSHFYRVCTSNL